MDPTSIDLRPIVQGIIDPLLTAVLLAALTWALKRVADFFHVQVQDGQRFVLERAITGALSWAEAKLPPEVGADARVAEAVRYLLPKLPVILKSLGITPEHLSEIITARLSR